MSINHDLFQYGTLYQWIFFNWREGFLHDVPGWFLLHFGFH